MTKNRLICAHQNLPIDGLQSYIQRALAEPGLTKEQEAQLAQQVYSVQDGGAAQKLVLAHLKVVIYLAKGYQGYGLAQADLIQQGNIGLLKAVKRFNPEFNVRFATFASHWIKAEMLEFVVKNLRLVKLATTKAQKKLFFNLNKVKAKLEGSDLRAPSNYEVAQYLQVDEKTVALMQQRLSTPEVSLDQPIAVTTEKKWELADPNATPVLESAIEKETLDGLIEALAHLDPRSRDIVAARWLSEPRSTLEQLAAQYKISIERVRQVERAALNRLKQALTFK